MTEARRITPDEIKRRREAGETFTFIDVRNPQAWSHAGTKLPGAIRATNDDLDTAVDGLSKDKPIVTYCT